VAVVAGTKTRIKVLEKLLNQPGLVVVGSAQDPVAAEELVVNARPAAVLLDLDLGSGGLEAIERIMANRATPIVVIGPAAEHPEAAIAAGAVDVVGALDVAPGSAEYAHMVMRHLKIASRVRVITHPRGRLRGRGVRGPATQSPPPPPGRRDHATNGSDDAALGSQRSTGAASHEADAVRRHVAQRPRPVPRRQDHSSLPSVLPPAGHQRSRRS
jgi:two-component system chemotaxis response regulator CheB